MSDAQPWTEADQLRADAFEQQILGLAEQLTGGHPDVIVVAFVQTTGSLMRQRLRDDPTRLAFYQNAIRLLERHVARPDSTTPPPATRHGH